MTYTGDVTPGGAADVRELDPPDDHQGRGRPEDVQQLLPAALPRHRRPGAHRRRRRAPTTLLPLIGDAGLTTVVTTHQHWDHHRALADVVAATGAEVVAGAPDAAAITEQTGVPVTRSVAQGDTVAVGDVHPRGDRDRRPHAGLDRPAVRTTPTATRTSSPATRSSRAASATRSATRRRSPSSSTRSRPRSSTGCPTTPGSTPATAATRRSAPSGPRCRSGASAAGEPSRHVGASAQTAIDVRHARPAASAVGHQPQIWRAGLARLDHAGRRAIRRPAASRPLPGRGPAARSTGGSDRPDDRQARARRSAAAGRTGSGPRRARRRPERRQSSQSARSKLQLVGIGHGVQVDDLVERHAAGRTSLLRPAKTAIASQSGAVPASRWRCSGARRPRRRAPAPACRRRSGPPSTTSCAALIRRSAADPEHPGDRRAPRARAPRSERSTSSMRHPVRADPELRVAALQVSGAGRSRPRAERQGGDRPHHERSR